MPPRHASCRRMPARQVQPWLPTAACTQTPQRSNAVTHLEIASMLNGLQKKAGLEGPEASAQEQAAKAKTIRSIPGGLSWPNCVTPRLAQNPRCLLCTLSFAAAHFCLAPACACSSLFVQVMLRLLSRHFASRRCAGLAPVAPRAFSSASKDTDSFLSGSNAIYAEEMHRAWLKDPTSVHASWQAYFKSVAAGVHPGQAFTPAPAPGTPMAASVSAQPSSLQTRVMQLVRAFQVRGHERSMLDPLGLWDPARFGGAPLCLLMLRIFVLVQPLLCTTV
jgi:hypothetical protein